MPDVVQTDMRPPLLLSRTAFAFVAIGFLPGVCFPADTEDTGAALSSYVEQIDDSYAWELRRSGLWRGVEFAELKLTSQTWKDITWKHQLYLIRPENIRTDGRHALLVIDGGRWNQRLEQTPSEELPSRAKRYMRIAKRVGTPVAVIRQVPFQPMFDGMTEDHIIAFTFDRYLETGDPEWPLLLPMVKSAVRAMDTMQEFSRTHWDTPVETFTVAGASKRGWTTWLTGAVDDRVTAIAPIVIDVVNMAPQMEYQEAVWGSMSEELAPYTELNLHRRLASEDGQALRSMVDPYDYLSDLNKPKLIVVGTNDRYWPLDALNLYWDDLIGQKHVLYIPNNGHGVKDYKRLFGSLNALHYQAAGSRPVLPELDWVFDGEADRVRLEVSSDVRPKKVRAWVARSANRDFREATWKSHKFRKDGKFFVYELDLPNDGYLALFGEATYGKRRERFYLSTNVRIFGASVDESPRSDIAP